MSEKYFLYNDLFNDGSNISLDFVRGYVVLACAKLSYFPTTVVVEGPVELEWIDDSIVRLQFEVMDGTVQRWVDCTVEKEGTILDIKNLLTGAVAYYN